MAAPAARAKASPLPDRLNRVRQRMGAQRMVNKDQDGDAPSATWKQTAIGFALRPVSTDVVFSANVSSRGPDLA